MRTELGSNQSVQEASVSSQIRKTVPYSIPSYGKVGLEFSVKVSDRSLKGDIIIAVIKRTLRDLAQ